MGLKSPQPIFSAMPPVLLWSAHLTNKEVCDIEETLRRCDAPLTTDISNAKVFIGKVGTKRRAEFELRSRKLQVEEFDEAKHQIFTREIGPPVKRRRVTRKRREPIRIDKEFDTEVETKDEPDETKDAKNTPPSSPPPALEEESPASLPLFEDSTADDLVWVIRLDWVSDCVIAGRLVPLGDSLVYTGKVLGRPPSLKSKIRSFEPTPSSNAPPVVPASRVILASRSQIGGSILDRARLDASRATPSQKHPSYKSGAHGYRRFDGKAFTSEAQQAGRTSSQLAHLLHQTTSEYNGEESDIPPQPEWVTKGLTYACQRRTPANPPNQDFIDLLKKIRTARTLIDDEIGVRAYSTSIAAIAAYPYKFLHPREILQLPGCDNKIASLWIEWKNTGKIRAVEDFENDEAMKVLRLFYDIWGVGAKTARQFYYKNNWMDLDDIIEFGWDGLDRVQQIGLKYYDEFLEGIPRAEVEQIASIVREHAIRLRDERVTVTIVGGYRRGKSASGDVDMIVSHPDLDATANLVKDIVESLEDAECITHTLTMSLHNTDRGQSTLPFRTTRAAGAGFDTLDKALVVWQDPNWPTKQEDREANPNARKPNVHRRVDIIVSPWRTVGCAVMGWSGGTTFQRDLRRYAKHAKGWKFDSSGIRSRHTGEIVQLEGRDGVAGTPEDAERKIFEGLGLDFIPPDQRCTN
ncbi:hypothetical protein BCR34DRAFT_478398 [Clohesyomyces aquaticus]|uniref:DNA polymerase n=1 Tax=Clohesyomyces aquaticus TaxID=1231657 RepID=A0A1Y1ZY25_9PLEO|nr:hypothetical protein BCR34DRAFT_478398 [Clohesyomyces aquaticus]